ncbi:sll0787 family AIR synthase-like protein [Phragmitibacter flavus]|nr:sll0787 family AIR synthase-like protein [Phragmitibacter flavus]
MPSSLEALVDSLRAHPNVLEKLHIATAYTPSVEVSQHIPIGDDTAVIPNGDHYLLFAAEGMMESFINLDPWFAGYCAVMVNLSDIAAMGGRPTAIVDVLWSHPDSPIIKEIWAGMRAASTAYNVPIVGGHTTRFPIERTPLLATAVLGRANAIISSFTAAPGQVLLMAIDLRAAYRGEGTLFWNGSVGAPPEQLQGDLDLLPLLAEQGLVIAGKDISNGGLPGTLAMLCATSRVGATVNLDELPIPPGIDLQRWLLSFPSYGYLLTAPPENVATVQSIFETRGLNCAAIGTIDPGNTIHFTQQQDQLRVPFCQVDFPPSQL